jgi:hypothetical protein
MIKMGLRREVERFEKGLCPSCAEPIDKETFRDDISLREYEISGFCQKCQDKIFGRGKKK